MQIDCQVIATASISCQICVYRQNANHFFPDNQKLMYGFNNASISFWTGHSLMTRPRMMNTDWSNNNIASQTKINQLCISISFLQGGDAFETNTFQIYTQNTNGLFIGMTFSIEHFKREWKCIHKWWRVDLTNRWLIINRFAYRRVKFPPRQCACQIHCNFRSMESGDWKHAVTLFI